jgi:hypothetical protein
MQQRMCEGEGVENIIKLTAVHLMGRTEFRFSLGQLAY